MACEHCEVLERVLKELMDDFGKIARVAGGHGNMYLSYLSAKELVKTKEKHKSSRTVTTSDIREFLYG